tara:strand:+ start:258 stop:920 length:663 start_codon:yes stop_codon:yes gene_type:complete
MGCLFNMHPYIYLVKNQQGKIVYVGQQIGTKSIDKYKGSGLLLNRAYKKYGEDKFIRERVEYCDEEFLNSREIYFISLYNTKFPHGYNLTDGGEGMKGYKYTLNQRNNISRSKLGQKYPKEHGEGIRQYRLGKTHTQETKDKISKTKASKYNITSDLSLRGQSKSNSQKTILQFNMKNDLIQEYQSAQDAGRCLRKSGNTIADAAAGRQKSAYGFLWRYK